MKTGAARRLDLEFENPSPEWFLEEIRRIINSGTLKGTREVAAQGLDLYPDHPELKRLHHVLRPHKARVVQGLRIPDRQDTFQWIEENWDKYRGQWIAILGTDLIAASPRFEDVRKAVQSRTWPALPLFHFFD